MKKSIVTVLLAVACTFAQPGNGPAPTTGETVEEAPKGPLCFDIEPPVRLSNGSLADKVCPAGFTLGTEAITVKAKWGMSVTYCLSNAPEGTKCDTRYPADMTQKIIDVMQYTYDSLSVVAGRKYAE